MKFSSVVVSFLVLLVVPLYKYYRRLLIWNRVSVTLRSMNPLGKLVQASGVEYADLPPGVGFEPKDEPVRRDRNLLGRILGLVIAEQEGRSLFGAEEEI